MRWIVLFVLGMSGLKGQANEPALSLRQKEEKMAQAFKSQNQLLKAVSVVLAEDVKNLKALNYLGLYHLKRGRLGLAQIIFERAVPHHPRSSALHNNLGLIALKENQKQQALLAFEKSLDYNKRYLPALINLSSLYMEFYNYKRALPLLSRAYSIVKDSREFRLSQRYVILANNYAVALTWSKEFEKARSLYHTLYKKDRLTEEGLINYAMLLVDHLKDIRKAKEVLNRADFLVKKSGNKKKIRDLRNQIRRMSHVKK